MSNPYKTPKDIKELYKGEKIRLRKEGKVFKEYDFKAGKIKVHPIQVKPYKTFKQEQKQKFFKKLFRK